MENQNSVLLRGELAQLPRWSHENHGRDFYVFELDVQRLSGAVGRLRVLAAEDVLEQLELSGGSMLEVSGQIRSFNNRQDTGRRLVISVYASRVAACEGESMNRVELTGCLCRPPVYRQTPLGREICDVMLAVGRRYHRSDYLPCILWGRAAREAARLRVGAGLHLVGRLQSRDYVKVLDTGSETRTAYEVSAVEVWPLPEEPAISKASGQAL